MSSTDVDKYVTKQEFPTKILVSFSLASCALGLELDYFLVWLPYYYEHIVGLPTIFYFIGFAIFTVWDAFDDLIAGVYTDKTYSFTKRWGKRFPWVLISSIFLGLVTIFVYLPPGVDIAGVWLTLAYFVIMLFIYDGLLSFWTVSLASVRSDKYRSDVDRRKIAAFQTVTGTIGGVIGSVTGGIFITLFGGLDIASAYVYTMGLFASIGTILAILALPGVKDSEKVLKRSIVEEEQGFKGWKDFKEFFKVMVNGFKNSNFRAYIVFTIANSVFGAIFAPSLTYFVTAVLKYEPEIAGSIVTLLAIPFTLAGILFIPLFLYLIRKYGHAKMFKLTLVIWPICLIPFLFVSDLISAMIVGAVIGALGGLLGVSMVPVLCDMIDEGSVLEGRRIDAKYNAINIFISRLGQVVFAATLYLIHNVLTDYNPAGGTHQSELAVFGIRAQIGLVPMIFFIIAAVYFIHAWKLKPEDMLEIKSKLMTMGIQKEE